MSGRLLRSDVRRAPPGAPCRALGAVEGAVLKLPLPQDQVLAPQRALDHLAQGAQGLALAVLLLSMRIVSVTLVLCRVVKYRAKFGGRWGSGAYCPMDSRHVYTFLFRVVVARFAEE